MPFSFSVPAFLSTRARCAFRTSRQPVARRSGAAAVLASIVAIAAASLTAPASGSMVVTVEDTAQGLKFSYSGSLKIQPTASFNAGSTTAIAGDGSIQDQFYSANGIIGFVSIGSDYTHLAPADGFFSIDFSPTSTPRGTNTSDAFGLRAGAGGMLIFLAPDYTSEDPIDGYGTILGRTIASTGFYDQVFTITGGSAAGETITLQAAPVPEPSTWALGTLALACGGWQLTRRRRARRVKA